MSRKFYRRSRPARWLIAGALVVALPFVGASCSNKARQVFNDASRGEEVQGSARIIPMPDGFNNVAAKCDGPNMVYTIFHYNGAYGSVSVVPNDPRCTGTSK